MKTVLAAGLAALLTAGAAQAQVRVPGSIGGGLLLDMESARLQQQGAGLQMQVQGLTAAQARLQAQQSLQALQQLRAQSRPQPVQPMYGGGGRPPRAPAKSGQTPPLFEPTTPALPAASARGDLPL